MDEIASQFSMYMINIDNDTETGSQKADFAKVCHRQIADNPIIGFFQHNQGGDKSLLVWASKG